MKRIVSRPIIFLLLIVTCIGVIFGYKAWSTSSSILTIVLIIGTIASYIFTRQSRLLPYALLGVYIIIGSETVDKLSKKSFIQPAYYIIGLIGFLWLREWSENNAKKKI